MPDPLVDALLAAVDSMHREQRKPRPVGLGARVRSMDAARDRLSSVLAAARAVASVDLAFAGAMQVAIADLRDALAAADREVAP